MMFKLSTKFKVGDWVKVIAGKEKGKEGKILSFHSKKNRVTIEGLNLIKKHQKGNQQLASKSLNNGFLH